MEGLSTSGPPRGRRSDTNAGNIKVHGIYFKGSHACLLLTFPRRGGLLTIGEKRS